MNLIIPASHGKPCAMVFFLLLNNKYHFLCLWDDFEGFAHRVGSVKSVYPCGGFTVEACKLDISFL